MTKNPRPDHENTWAPDPETIKLDPKKKFNPKKWRREGSRLRATTIFIGPYAHDIGAHNSLACWRIVRWICGNVEDCDFVQYGDIPNLASHYNIKNIVYFYSSFYAKFDQIINLMQSNSRANLYWLYNEYTLALNSSIFRFFKEREFSVITNLMQGCPKDITLSAKKIYTINTNITAYRDNVYDRPWNKRPFDLIYYGSYRPNRNKYVVKYFSDAYISTTEKNERLFKTAGLVNNQYIGVLRWIHEDLFIKRNISLNKPTKNLSSLDMYKFSVYIEDEGIHQDRYNNLSDRFYECISHGVVLFFDRNCQYNISQSKYNIPDYFFVSNKDELKGKMREMDKDESGRKEYFSNIKSIVKSEKNDFRKEIKTILNG